MKRFMVIFTLCFPLISFGNDGFWGQHAKGWHWYRGPKLQNQEVFTSDVKSDPIQTMKSLQATLERALDTAILQPTPEHVKNYIQLQNKVNQQASLFSDVWRRLLWHNPDLDYSLQHPTSQLAKQAYADTELLQAESAVRSLAKTHGLFFFFKGSCPYCHRFAPILKHFAEYFGLSVIPITLDGGLLPEFPDARGDNGISGRLQVAQVPALFAVAPSEQSIIRLGYGLMSESELLQRVLVLTQRHLGKDY